MSPTAQVAMPVSRRTASAYCTLEARSVSGAGRAGKDGSDAGRTSRDSFDGGRYVLGA